MAENVSTPERKESAGEEKNSTNIFQQPTPDAPRSDHATTSHNQEATEVNSSDSDISNETEASQPDTASEVLENDPLKKVMQERDEYLNHLKRLQAEFDNFRKRTQKERSELKEYLLEDFIRKLLDVIENMERALHPDNQTDDVDSYRAGVEIVFEKMMSILKEYGLTRVDSVGTPFDPRFHEAVMNVESDEHEPGIIVNEFTAGYCLKDRVLKAPKVQVSVKPAVNAEKSSNTSDSDTSE